MFYLKLAYLVTNQAIIIWLVYLVANKRYLHSLLAIFFYLLQPVIFNAFKRLVVVQIKCYNDPLGTFIVRTGDGPELFLSSGVPDLQFDEGIIDIKGPILARRVTWTWNPLRLWRDRFTKSDHPHNVWANWISRLNCLPPWQSCKNSLVLLYSSYLMFENLSRLYSYFQDKLTYS